MGRIRSADDDYFTRLRRRLGAPGLDTCNEQGCTTLSRRTVATDHADATCHRVLDFKSAGHDGMHVCWDCVRYRLARRQGSSHCVSGARRSAVAICSTVPGPATKSGNFSRQGVQVFPEIFRRTINCRSLTCARCFDSPRPYSFYLPSPNLPRYRYRSRFRKRELRDVLGVLQNSRLSAGFVAK